MKKNERIEIRLTENLKRKLRQAAEEKGMTMTELVLLRVQECPLPDHKYKKALFVGINDVSREINAIGNNINQAVTALHLIKNGHKMDEGDFAHFLQELTVYNALLNGLKQYFATLLEGTP